MQFFKHIMRTWSRLLTGALSFIGGWVMVRLASNKSLDDPGMWLRLIAAFVPFMMCYTVYVLWTADRD